MASFNEIEAAVTDLAKYIDDTVEGMESATMAMQERITLLLLEQVMRLETSEGILVRSQDFRGRLAQITSILEKQFASKVYKNSVKDFLTNFDTIQDRTISLHTRFSDLQIQLQDLTPAKQIIYNRAVEGFSSGAIAEAYIEPVKQLLASQVLTGASITKTVKAIEDWGKGEMSSGRLNNGTPAPNLQRYATQIARDTAYSVNRVTNGIIAEKFNLTKFIYAGNIIRDSRPLCRHLVALNREISIDELPPLIALYPSGLFPNTTKNNFLQYNGGFSCRHISHVVS